MRIFSIAAAALLLAACGGEQYPVPAAQAYASLASLGTPPGLYPLPGPLDKIGVRFEAVPGANAVQWLFTHDGDDLGRIVATVAGSGKGSAVTIDYADGNAPDGNWHNKEAREQIEAAVRGLVAEAVDARLENRQFNMALRDQAEATVTSAMIGGVMGDVATRMKDEMRKADEYENDPSTIERRRRLQETAASTRDNDRRLIETRKAADATRPASDLSQYH
jgi:hypothetical protein